MSFIDIDTFKSKIKDFARPNRFYVYIYSPYFPFYDVSYYVKSAKIPSRSLPEIAIKKYGYTLFLSSDTNPDNLVIGFYNDYDFIIRKNLENWFNNMHLPPDQRKGLFEIYKKSHIYIMQLGRSGEVLITYKFYSVIPISISEITLDHSQENAIEEFSVEFKYSYYELE